VMLRKDYGKGTEIFLILDQERLNCPFGLSDGAWFAWRTVVSLSNKRMTEFAHRKRHV